MSQQDSGQYDGCRHAYELIRDAEYRDDIEITHRCRTCNLLVGYRYHKARLAPFDHWEGTPPDRWGAYHGRIR